MIEHQQHAVEVGVEPIVVQLDQPQHVEAERGAGRLMDMGFGGHAGGDHRAEGPLVSTGLLDQFDPPLAQQHLGVDDVDLLFQGVLQQAGGKGGRDQPGVLAGHLAPIVQRAAA